MKGLVVTLMNHPGSVECAERCIESGAAHGFEVEKWEATTAEKSREVIAELGLKVGKWSEKFSSTEAVLGNFASQYRAWKAIVAVDEPVVVLEHDAVFRAPLPDIKLPVVLQIGRPSHGVFREKKNPGVYKLFSKKRFPGAHAYIVTPAGAKMLVRGAQNAAAGPVDLFLSASRFPELMELYPWIVEAVDSFSTIQNERGCRAKHRFDEHYRPL